MQTLKVREKKVSVHTYNYDNIIEFLNITKDILENPMYVILNLCRAHAYQKEDQVLSKKQGAEWCLRQIPAKYIPVIQAGIAIAVKHHFRQK